MASKEEQKKQDDWQNLLMVIVLCTCSHLDDILLLLHVH